MIHGDYKSRTIWFSDTSGKVKQLLPYASRGIINHSPTGFNWGYAGSGPAQLALALLLHFSKDPELAERYYQSFKRDFVANLPQEDFDVDEIVVTEWIKHNCK